MGLLANLLHPKKAATDQSQGATVGSPTSPLRHIPSFNEFAGDTTLAIEADAECGRVPDDLIKARPAETDVAPQPDVWRSVFDPGSNPNMHRVGKQVFDNVADTKTAPTTWDFILRGEQRKESFGDLDVGRKGFVNESDLKAAFNNNGECDTRRLMAQADADKDGRISRQEFKAVAARSKVGALDLGDVVSA